MSKQRGLMQAERHVWSLIRAAGCQETVRVAAVALDKKHFVFVLENPLTKLQARLTMSHGAGARSGTEWSLRGANIRLIRTVAGTRKVA
jgi:hypothetical protein